MGNTFTDEDKKKVVQFLNHIARHAKFKHTVQESIDFFKLLNYMQADLLKKIDDNTLEIKKVVETQKDDF